MEILELRCTVSKKLQRTYFALPKLNWGNNAGYLTGTAGKQMQAKFRGTQTAIEKAAKTLRKTGFAPKTTVVGDLISLLSGDIAYGAGCHQDGVVPEKLETEAIKSSREKFAHEAGELEEGCRRTITALKDACYLIGTPEGKLRLSTGHAKWALSQDMREMNLLLEYFQTHLHELQKLRKANDSHWGGEDPFYRYFHQSLKVYWVQGATKKITEFLNRAGDHAFGKDKWNHPKFVAEILRDGQGRTFNMAHNSQWRKKAKPILDAFLYAREFLKFADRYAGSLEEAPQSLPSGWAALLYYYNKR